MKHHPSILAFGYTYIPQHSTERSYEIINAPDLASFKALTAKDHDVLLCNVSHVAADGATITDIIWDRNTSSYPYTDGCANNSWVFADMDRIAHGDRQ